MPAQPRLFWQRVLNLLITRLTAKTVALTIVAVVVVAVVPLTVLSVAPGDDTAGHLVLAASHARTHPTPAKRVPPRVRFKSDADQLIAELTDAEAVCVASVRALIGKSRLTANQTKPILDKARSRLDAGVQPLIGVLQRDEASVALTTALAPIQLATYTTDLETIRLIALPSSGKLGSIAILCSSVIVQVQQEIAVLKRPSSSGGGYGGGGDGGGGGD